MNAIDIAQVVEAAGASALTVHGRTAADFFSGSADWDQIARIKEHLRRMPLIGNGDLDSAEKVVTAFRRYPVDGVMIALAALSKPWLFRQAQAGAPRRADPARSDPGRRAGPAAASLRPGRRVLRRNEGDDTDARNTPAAMLRAARGRESSVPALCASARRPSSTPWWNRISRAAVNEVRRTKLARRRRFRFAPVAPPSSPTLLNAEPLNRRVEQLLLISLGQPFSG